MCCLFKIYNFNIAIITTTTLLQILFFLSMIKNVITIYHLDVCYIAKNKLFRITKSFVYRLSNNPHVNS